MGTTIRSAYSVWPGFNARLRAVVAGLSEEQLALQPTPGRWPLWATVGHIACQRVSWLCGFAGEPGADATPFPDALHRCPGDEYLEPVMTAKELSVAIDSTFKIVDTVLDTWMADDLGEEIRRAFGGEPWVYTRGEVVQRVFAHDVYHVAELNETLTRHDLGYVDLWDW
jgi:uncharacterized damage-inducible protein DinB